MQAKLPREASTAISRRSLMTWLTVNVAAEIVGLIVFVVPRATIPQDDNIDNMVWMQLFNQVSIMFAGIEVVAQTAVLMRMVDMVAIHRRSRTGGGGGGGGVGPMRPKNGKMCSPSTMSTSDKNAGSKMGETIRNDDSQIDKEISFGGPTPMNTIGRV
eukprot:jgi/Hompol1/3230/HPOL_006415-RA